MLSPLDSHSRNRVGLWGGWIPLGWKQEQTGQAGQREAVGSQPALVLLFLSVALTVPSVHAAVGQAGCPRLGEPSGLGAAAVCLWLGKVRWKVWAKHLTDTWSQGANACILYGLSLHPNSCACLPQWHNFTTNDLSLQRPLRGTFDLNKIVHLKGTLEKKQKKFSQAQWAVFFDG